MKPKDFICVLADRTSMRSRFCNLFSAAALLFAVFFMAGPLIAPYYKEKTFRWGVTVTDSSTSPIKSPSPKVHSCEKQCRLPGTESLPEGIIEKTSNLQMRPLWGFPKAEETSVNLFAMAVGIKQKDLVNKMVTKFLDSGFVVMLFHYDGVVDDWKSFEWSNNVVHVSAGNQTKWWFAKRFLHPDIVAKYSYIFLWDEDLGVENFNPERYVAIVKSEGLEISQPALDPTKSEVHHQITARGRNSIVHRRTYKPGVNGTGCYGNSKTPPCTGWVEMMAPVFSRAAWRCVWYMIQNDLIHAWGLDMRLGYCAQGDRTEHIGVVDAEYVVHYNRPTLGGTVKGPVKAASHRPRLIDPRVEVRRQSYIELDMFKKRWRRAVKKDKCWVDPYQ